MREECREDGAGPRRGSRQDGRGEGRGGGARPSGRRWISAWLFRRDRGYPPGSRQPTGPPTGRAYPYSRGRPGRRRRAALRPHGRVACLALVLAAAAVTTGPALPASAATTTIEDTSIGTGLNQVSYSGTWTRCGGCTPNTPNNSFQYSSDYGSIATVRFSGTQVNVFGIKEPRGGFAAFSIDDGTPAIIDTFASTPAATLLYSSNTLASGAHMVKIINVHLRNAASGSYSVGFDRVEVTTDDSPPSPPPPTQTAQTIEDTTVGTGLAQVSYASTWQACGGCQPPSPNDSFHYSSTAGASATIRFSGTQINIYGIKEAHGGFATVSLDGGQAQQIDTYAPTSSVTLLYSSDKLAAGNHTVTLTNTHLHNSASDSYAVGFDRAEVTAGANPAPSPPSYAGPRSGKPWLSGTNGDPVMNPASVDAFCNWRGTPCDFALLYVPRYNWGATVEPTALLDTFAKWPGKLIISIPPYPDDGVSNNATCATGAYDSYWRTFGQTLNRYGRQDSLLRVGWESNGNWYPWSGTNPTQFINCWRHVVDSINATAEPDPTMCWCLNGHYSQNPPSHNALDLYPGDAWVDGVGYDSYDHWPPARTKAEFDAQANAMGGINYYYNFARAHNKLFGVGEWGVVSGSGVNGGGDSANYIQWMHDWFVAHAGKGLAYEFYFNNCEPTNVGSNLYRPLGPGCTWSNPNAAKRYQELF
jgi:hypothetical protein